MKLLTVADAAAELGVHYDTALDWIHRGKLRASRLGFRTYRVTPAAIEECLVAAEVGPEAGPERSEKTPKTAQNHRGRKKVTLGKDEWRRHYGR